MGYRHSEKAGNTSLVKGLVKLIVEGGGVQDQVLTGGVSRKSRHSQTYRGEGSRPSAYRGRKQEIHA